MYIYPTFSNRTIHFFFLECIGLGAPDRIVELCTRVIEKEQQQGLSSVPMTDEIIQTIHQSNLQMAGEGLRVLGLSYKILPDSTIPPSSSFDENDDNTPSFPREQLENDLIFVGLTGIEDPPRPGVKESVEICKKAGIIVHMLTGDHPATAVAIAKQVNIYYLF